MRFLVGIVVFLANAHAAPVGNSALRGHAVPVAEDEAENPYLLPLQRETVPVRKNGLVVALKTAYSGKVSVGGQEFSVVFDTGSGHVVLPSATCDSNTCLAHRRYNITNSPKAWPVNADGGLVPEDDLCDQATIGYGTGSITGEFVHESVCLGPAQPQAKTLSLKGVGEAQRKDALCTTMNVIAAVEMSAQPFESFGFDGIFGLGLDSLALTSEFSFFSQLSAQPKQSARFAFFLGSGEHGDQSEIAVGGHNSDRLMGPLTWAPIANPKLGFWNIKINAVRIGGVDVVNCKKGACKGILDTGTSHLGIPSQHLSTVSDLLSKNIASAADCRSAEAPTLSIEINGFTISLGPEDYMQNAPSSGNALPAPAQDAAAHSAELALHAKGDVQICKPRIMPVDMKKPLGPNLFLLGEPVLRRYYTVYDWHSKRVGFGLANSRRNRLSEGASPSTDAKLKVEAIDALEGEDEEIYLMQMSVTISMEISPCDLPAADTPTHTEL